jgi:CubicO group peptidase (beta-lactamase class C family)
MSREVEELFEKAVKVSGAVGAQLSYVQDGKQLDFVYGQANAKLGMPLQVETAIQVGSITKVFNAALIMSLVEEGKLDLDAPVSAYVPEFALVGNAAADAITLRRLLSMSSGIDNGDYQNYGDGTDALAKRVHALKQSRLHFAPGSAFGYSNAGIDIAGHIAERVTGQIWDDLLSDHILTPAGLESAATTEHERIYQRVSVGHVVSSPGAVPEIIRPWRLSRGIGPAGATLTITAHDLARFAMVFVNKGLADTGRRVLSAESVTTMMTPQIEVPISFLAQSWCLGPAKKNWGSISVWGHRGGNISGAGYLYWLPDKNGVLAWITNTPTAFPRFDKIVAQDIMHALYAVSQPVLAKPAVPIAIDPRRYVGKYEAFGGSLIVEEVDGELSLTSRWKNYINEVEVIEDRVLLAPLGGDRFIIDRGDQTDAMSLAEDTAFSGNDSKGRATNLIHVAFPCSRVQ